MRRTVVLGSVVSVVLGSVALGATPADAKPVTPTVSSISSPAGPLSAKALMLRGQNLQLVKKVRFGSAAATKVQHHGSRSLTLRAPATKRAAIVRVAVFSGGTWRNTVTYTYLARPVVTRLSRSSGPVSGGYPITVTGQAVSYTPVVRIGGSAVPVVSRTGTSLKVTAPAGVLGGAPVTVTTPGGTSAAAARSVFTYSTPAPVDSVDYTPAAATVTADGVQWVSRPDATGDDASQDNYAPWIVSLAAGSTLPDVGAGYFLRPGGDVYPSGFAGTVRSLASQQDGTTRVTVDPAPLDDTLDQFSLEYAPTVAAAGAARPDSRRVASAGGQAFSFAGLRANVFDCTHGSDGELATFTGEVGLRFDDVRPVFDVRSGLNPSVDAYVTGAVTAYGKVSVDATMTCTLKKSWVNANKKIIAIGATGATVSFAPAASLTITGNATASVEQTTHFTYGLKIAGDNGPSFYQSVRQDATKSSANATVTVDATLGVAVQIGWLDRVGVDIGAELYVNGKLTYTSSPRQVCGDIGFGFELSVKGFLDLFFKRWETETATKRFQFARFTKCSAPDSAALPDGAPQIVSSTLPDATAGSDYSAQLQTADNRNGSWSIVGGSLPAGLTLSGDELTGTPSSVGTFRPVVRFTDALGQQTSTTLSVRVLPGAGLGGGDIQATLTWGSAADLDLHAVEPSGTEIYYDTPGPTDTGGELDHDANANCDTVDPAPAENIFWPSRSAATGAYYFTVDTYKDCGTDDLDWHLVVRVQGRVVLDRTGSGTSDSYELDYGANGQLRVRTRPVSVQSVSRTPK